MISSYSIVSIYIYFLKMNLLQSCVLFVTCCGIAGQYDFFFLHGEYSRQVLQVNNLDYEES